MTPGARCAAVIAILDDWLDGQPIEKLLSNWARRNRYAGSKDRAHVRDIVFDCLRNRDQYAAWADALSGRAIVVGYCLSVGSALEDVFSGEKYAPDVLTAGETSALSSADTQACFPNLPEWIDLRLRQDLGSDYAAVNAAMGQRAPVDLRVNLARASRDDVQVWLKDETIETIEIAGVPGGLRVVENPRRVAGSQVFADGLIELQDAASQAVVDQVPIQSGDKVLDFCAGGGGKSLAMAAKVPDAKFSAWDISQARLAPLKERAKRARARVTLLKNQPQEAEFDVVFVDAPCSGSGAWRRSPEGKWRLTEDRLDALRDTQREVLTQASRCVRPGGTLVYATCSLFSCENGTQINQFLVGHEEFVLKSERTFLVNSPGDGFYCAILNKQL